MSLTEHFTGTEQSLNAFEELYIDVRQKEGRVMADDDVLFLPDVDPLHLHYNEWQIRKRSAQRLITYLKKKRAPLRILEVGCGNGWLSAMLSSIPKSQVKGLDINRVEIEQARRVFNKTNLEFFYSYFDHEVLSVIKYDIIVFAASIQYFHSLNDILQDALKCLSPLGEIHLIDSHFYRSSEIDAAAERTKNYYTALGYPQMADNYYHHTVTDLRNFNYQVLLDPATIFNRLTKRSPFYWFCITHK